MTKVKVQLKCDLYNSTGKLFAMNSTYDAVCEEGKGIVVINYVDAESKENRELEVLPQDVTFIKSSDYKKIMLKHDMNRMNNYRFKKGVEYDARFVENANCFLIPWFDEELNENREFSVHAGDCEILESEGV